MSETPAGSPAAPAVDTSALDRSAASIDDARGALSAVSANDDVSTEDDQQAGVASEDPVQASRSADEITDGEGERGEEPTDEQPGPESRDDSRRDDDPPAGAKADPSAP